MTHLIRRLPAANRRTYAILSTISLVLGLGGYVAAPSALAASGFSIKWGAADPTTYTEKLPADLTCPTGGTGADPYHGATYGGSVTALSPDDLTMGHVLAFEAQIDAGVDSGTVIMHPSWDTETTSHDPFGYDPTKKLLCAFVDTGDAATTTGTAAKVDSYSSPTVSTPDPIQGTVQVSGIAAHETVVVEMWVVLDDTIPASATGNIQARIDSAQTGTGSRINVGTQVIAVNKVSDFVRADLSVTKSDSPDPVIAGQNVTYIVRVTNNSSTYAATDVVAEDVLDANETFVAASSSSACSLSGGHVRCTAASLAAGAHVDFTIVATVSATAPDNDTSATAHEDGAAGTACPASTATTPIDICNRVAVSSATLDQNATNDAYYQPTNVTAAPRAAIALDKGSPTTLITASGQQVPYTFHVTNPGQVGLTGVYVSDALCPAPNAPTYVSGDTGTVGTLSPGGEDWLFTCTHTVTATEFAGSSLPNTAYAYSDQAGPASDTYSIRIMHPNVLVYGHVTAVKTLTGDVAGAEKSFTFHVACPAAGYATDLTVDATSTTHSASTPDAIPVGTPCTVTETGTYPHWTLASVTPHAAADATQGTATAATGQGSGNTVTFVNARNTGVVTVKKTVSGDPAGASTAFTFDVTCPAYVTSTGPGFPWAQQTVTLDTGSAGVAIATTDPIPTGVDCIVSEQPTSGWQQTDPASGGDVPVTVPGTAPFVNTRNAGDLQLVKSVHTLAGPNNNVGSFTANDPHNTLVYALRLSVSQPGTLDHTGVVVTDYLPGYRPGDDSALTTTYVADSATCSTGCDVNYDDSKHLLTWDVGDVAHDADAVVLTFRVTIDTPTPDASGAIPAGAIANVGFVASDQQDPTASNRVRTTVLAVEGEKHHRPAPQPAPLPFTGSSLPIPLVETVALAMLGVGAVLVAAGRRRRND